MLKTYTIPSVIEANSFELKQVAPDLLNGLRVYHNEMPYLVGDLAILEGSSPQKTLNSSPEETDYRVLAKSAMLLASQENSGALYITTGFPTLTYQLYRKDAEQWFQNNHNFRHDTSTYSMGETKENAINVVKAFVIPELAGCDLAIRKADFSLGDYFIISLGYGTFEAALSTKNGLVHRTMVSGQGVRYAITAAAKELKNTHKVGLKTEHQIDTGFRNGQLTINRKMVNVGELRKKYLTTYYKQVISPVLAKTFSDDDFGKAKAMIIVGGGAMYDELINMFREEFESFIPVRVFDDPASAASKGYALHSERMGNDSNATPVGIDIGNSSTVVSFVTKDGFNNNTTPPPIANDETF
ncbi:MAG: hypothetical protein C0592_12300 [Marinilabiliales bacterium]|nr:MAG: hypothetical protein C0592_12300 [Marinilabiliales bacterium]